MAENDTNNLRVVVSGVIDRSLTSAFSTANRLMQSMERGAKTLTSSLGLNTRAQQLNGSSIGARSRAVSGATSLSRRYVDALNKETVAATRMAEASKKLTAAGKEYYNSDAYMAHRQAASLGLATGLAGTILAGREGAGMENTIIQNIITDNSAISRLPALRGQLSDLGTKQKTGQNIGALSDALSVYTSANMTLNEGITRLQVAGRVATATGSSVTSIAQTELAMKSMFGIMGKDAQDTANKTSRAWNILASAGKDGSFELRNMATELTEIGSRAQRLKITGEKNLAWVAGALQAQVKNAGDPKTAANNLVNIMDKMAGAPDFAENAKKLGIDMVQLRKQAYANPTGPNVIELFVDKFQKVLDRTPEAKRDDVLGKLVQDRQAREGLNALVQHRLFIKEVQSRGLDNASKDIISADYNKAMASANASWLSITSSMERFGQVALIVIAPTLRILSTGFEAISRWTLRLTESSSGLAGIAFPVLALASAYGAMALKLRAAAWVANLLGFTKLSGVLSKVPSLFTLVGRSWGFFTGIFRGGIAPVLNGLNRLRLFSGLLLARFSNFAGPLGRGLLTGLRSFGPILVRGLGLALRGVGTFLTGAVGTLLSTILSVILAAFVGWKLGKWLYESTGVGRMLDSLADQLTGFQARIDRMNSNKTPGRGNYAGVLRNDRSIQAEANRRAALQQWESYRKRAADGLIAKKNEWWTSSGDKQEMSLLRAEKRTADRQIEAIRAQLNSTQGAVGAAKASAGASKFSTQVNVNVAGGDKSTGDAVAAAVARKLDERDRDYDRRYRGSASRGGD